MKIKDLRFICWWEYQLRLGRVKFSMSYGIAAGLIIGIINSLILAFVPNIVFDFTLSTVIKTTTLCFLLSILFYYTAMWSYYNWYYKRIKKRQG
ncbi:MAG: hypothetical protein LBI72_09455 [Flavobacteriaceae bacterium]|jgi:putative Ca2+/H+ antiporter (TMEM165/GDT1 family)|nr:hypothetical protein [Flavobacteriaceae bacterium]